MAGAIQPRVNKAIIDRLSADTVAAELLPGTSLQELLRDAGGLLEPGWRLPLYWWAAPAPASLPHIVYGPQTRDTELVNAMCAVPFAGEILYDIRYIVDGIQPASAIGVVDRIADLLDAYSGTAAGAQVLFSRVSEFCYPDFIASEKSVTVSGIVFRCHVNLGE